MSPETSDENPTDPLSYDELFANRTTVLGMESFDLLRNAQFNDETSHTNRLHDTTPYSEHWSRLTQNAKQNLKPYLEGKVIIDLFGGLWENGRSYIRALAKELGARQYILQDAYMMKSSGRELPSEGYLLNTILEYPEFDGPMKIDFTDGDGLFMAKSIPDNMPDVVFFLNGVNRFNIDSWEYHAYLAWEIARALPPGGVVACSGSDASNYFEQLGLEEVHDFNEPTALWIKPENHTLLSRKEWEKTLYQSRRW